MSSGFGGLGGLQAGLGVVGGITSIIGAVKQADAAKAAGRRAQEAAEANALILEELGLLALAEGRRNTLRLISDQRAAFAANGVNIGTGSALDVALDTSIEGEVAAQLLKYGFDTQAYQERVKGALAAFSGNVAASSILQSGLIQGTNTILGGFNEGLGTFLDAPNKVAPSTRGGTVPFVAPHLRPREGKVVPTDLPQNRNFG